MENLWANQVCVGSFFPTYKHIEMALKKCVYYYFSFLLVCTFLGRFGCQQAYFSIAHTGHWCELLPELRTSEPTYIDKAREIERTYLSSECLNVFSCKDLHLHTYFQFQMPGIPTPPRIFSLFCQAMDNSKNAKTRANI